MHESYINNSLIFCMIHDYEDIANMLETLQNFTHRVFGGTHDLLREAKMSLCYVTVIKHYSYEYFLMDSIMERSWPSSSRLHYSIFI